MTKCNIRVHWVKVRGHSDQHGNNKADDSATWGQNGGRKNVEDMERCMEWLEGSTETADAQAAEAERELNAGH